jgi:hypothetical protein
MYDAEFGRASGAVVNAITKSGTNQFKGVAFVEGASNKLTAADYFVRTRNLEKPSAVRRDWGGVLGGPIVKNKAHFFVSLERQVDNPNRTRVFDTRPSLTFSQAEDRTDWNTLFRYDHQVSKNHSLAVRWLREWAPQWYTFGDRQTQQSYQDETDLDQTAVVTMTSVLGNARVNTFRFARTWEHWWHGNACFRTQGGNDDRAGFTFGEEAAGNQALCPPQLDNLSFLAQASTESQGPWDSNYQFEDDYSWFIPNKKGDHDMKFGVRYNYTELRRVSQVNANGTFRFNTDLPFDALNPRTYPERLTIRTGTFNEFINNHTYEAFAQDKWRLGPQTTVSLGVRYDLEIIPLDESTNPLFGGSSKSPTDKNNFARVGVTHSLDPAASRAARRLRNLLQLTILGASTTRWNSASSVERRPVPGQRGRSGSERRASRPIRPGQRPGRQQALLRQSYPLGVASRTTGRVRLAIEACRTHQFTFAMCASWSRRWRCTPTTSDGEPRHVPGAQPQPGSARRHQPHRKSSGGMPLASSASPMRSRWVFQKHRRGDHNALNCH